MQLLFEGGLHSSPSFLRECVRQNELLSNFTADYLRTLQSKNTKSHCFLI